MLREKWSISLGALLIVASIVAPASEVAAEASRISLPASLLGNPKQLWRAVMTSFYGQYDNKLKCWVGRNDTNSAYCMKPLKLDVIDTNDGKAAYISIGGQALGKDGEVNYSGADGQGAIGLIVMSQQGKRLVTSATNSLYASAGTFGRIVSGPRDDNVSLRKIGHDNWAWFIQTGLFYSGNGAFSHTIEVPIGDKVIQVGQIPSSMFQEESGPCKPHCANLEADLLIDSHDGAKQFSPIIVQIYDKNSGTKTDRTFRVPFNDSKLQYEAPDALIELMRNPYTE